MIEELAVKIPAWAAVLGQLVMALVILATVIARLTPSPKDDEVVGKARQLVLKVVKYLPTVGINPQTKKLEEAAEEVKKA